MLETDLRKLVHDLAAAAEEEGVGLAILIDEAQDLSEDELIAVCAIAHAAARNLQQAGNHQGDRRRSHLENVKGNYEFDE